MIDLAFLVYGLLLLLAFWRALKADAKARKDRPTPQPPLQPIIHVNAKVDLDVKALQEAVDKAAAAGGLLTLDQANAAMDRTRADWSEGFNAGRHYERTHQPRSHHKKKRA